MDGLMNQMRRAAQEAIGTGGATRHGIIDAYDPNAYAVKVTLQPDDTLTDWLPLKSPWVGNGWGLFCPPSRRCDRDRFSGGRRRRRHGGVAVLQ
jgi:hypothetical protein